MQDRHTVIFFETHLFILSIRLWDLLSCFLRNNSRYGHIIETLIAFPKETDLALSEHRKIWAWPDL